VGLPAIGRGDAVDRVGPDQRRRVGRGERHRRPPAGAHGLDRLHERAPVGHDHLVARAEVLARAVLDRPHALDRPLVVQVDVVLAHAEVGARALVFRIEAPVIVAAVDRRVVGQGHAGQALRAHRFLVERLGEAGEERVPVGVRVVDRHMHLRDRDRLRERDHEGRRKRGMGDAHVGEAIGHRPQRRQAQQAVGDGVEADLGAMELAHDPRHRPALAADVAGARGAELATVGLVVGHRSVVQVAVQERRMRRIDADLERLQPVAVPQALEGEAVAGRGDEGVERRQAQGVDPSAPSHANSTPARSCSG
jgi:hypothetical protein